MGGGILRFLIIYNFFVIFIQSFLVINFNNFLNPSFLEAFLNTNMAESIEFVSIYINFKFFGILIFMIVALFLLKIKINIKINNKLNIAFIILIFVVCFGNDLRRAIKYDFSRYINIPFIKFNKELIYTDDILINSKIMQESYLKIANNHEKLKANENIKNIVLIIGESSRRSAYQDYGQGLNTTPNLINIKNKIIYSDVIAPYASTNPVMSVLLNFANLDNLSERKFYENLDIINLFKLANYKTFWISNQDYISEWGNNAASVGIMSDFSYFTNKYMSSSDTLSYAKYDGVLLPIIKNLKLSDNNFIVIHLLGNHGNYKKRYPKEFAKFNESDIKTNISDKKSIAEYYNSILYTDYIIQNIYDIFKNDDSLIIYLSDHAESLYDDKSKSVLGHILGKITAEIPFIILYSNSFKENHKKLLKDLNKAKDLPFMSDDLIHLICDITGIYPIEYKSYLSPLRSDYKKDKIRLFGNELKYNKF
ncbi:phosphoethanolamine transferase [Campylobacter sp. RM12647]|uniref:phosphoethanolamine transferase n=1 Tax=Campylobacter sp. RM12647 TaxID=2735737 RepID=UPI001D2673AB|nr:phosphoethanolamine transferase [Campylobacter sp. RM12647]